MKLIIHCCYHKAGTQLFGKVLRVVSNKYNLKHIVKYGFYENHNADVDIIMYGNSNINIENINREYVGSHMIRDPRDVIISGYLYHLNSKEKWCTNKCFDKTEPINHPRVPYSQEKKNRNVEKSVSCFFK